MGLGARSRWMRLALGRLTRWLGRSDVDCKHGGWPRDSTLSGAKALTLFGPQPLSICSLRYLRSPSFKALSPRVRLYRWIGINTKFLARC